MSLVEIISVKEPAVTGKATVKEMGTFGAIARRLVENVKVRYALLVLFVLRDSM